MPILRKLINPNRIKLILQIQFDQLYALIPNPLLGSLDLPFHLQPRLPLIRQLPLHFPRQRVQSHNLIILPFEGPINIYHILHNIHIFLEIYLTDADGPGPQDTAHLVCDCQVCYLPAREIVIDVVVAAGDVDAVLDQAPTHQVLLFGEGMGELEG